MGDLLRRECQRSTIAAQPRGQLREDPRDLDQLFFGELDQAVIQIDSFERLDKHRLARGARSMHHAGNRAPVRRAHRNNESIASQRDVVFRRRTAPRQNTFQ